MNSDPSLSPAHVLSQENAAQRLSPVDLMDALLARIAAHDPKLHAFVEVYAAEAAVHYELVVKKNEPTAQKPGLDQRVEKINSGNYSL